MARTIEPLTKLFPLRPLARASTTNMSIAGYNDTHYWRLECGHFVPDQLYRTRSHTTRTRTLCKRGRNTPKRKRCPMCFALSALTSAELACARLSSLRNAFSAAGERLYEQVEAHGPIPMSPAMLMIIPYMHWRPTFRIEIPGGSEHEAQGLAAERLVNSPAQYQTTTVFPSFGFRQRLHFPPSLTDVYIHRVRRYVHFRDVVSWGSRVLLTGRRDGIYLDTDLNKGVDSKTLRWDL